MSRLRYNRIAAILAASEPAGSWRHELYRRRLACSAARIEVQVFFGVDIELAAGFEQRVVDGADPPGGGAAEEEPVFLPMAVGRMA